MPLRNIRGISLPFGKLSPCRGQVAYVLLTRAPVAGRSIATSPLPLDLHVLSLSLAFILSQDQTLRCLYCFLFLQYNEIICWPGLPYSLLGIVRDNYVSLVLSKQLFTLLCLVAKCHCSPCGSRGVAPETRMQN